MTEHTGKPPPRSRCIDASRASDPTLIETPIMKTRISILLLLATFTLPFSTSVAATVSNDMISAAYSVSAVDVDRNGTSIARGTTRMTVLRLLGASYRKLSEDTWMYHGFSSSYGPANRQSCNQLVITFAKGKVTDIALVNRDTALLIAKGVPMKLTGSIVAAK
jgi:outer membrane protein assembly factor BamE (lipoprotein component of BamABCDE complex)